MKFLRSPVGIVILAVFLGVGTTAVQLFLQRSIFIIAPAAPGLPPRLWGFKTDEIDNMIADLKTERDKLDKREENLDQTASHIEAERQELERMKASIQAMRDEIAKEIPEIKADEVKNLKNLSQVYSNLTPPAAVAIFREMDDSSAVKILALMKPDKVGAILDEMSHQDDKDNSMVKRAARISDRLRLLKPIKPAAPQTPS